MRECVGGYCDTVVEREEHPPPQVVDRHCDALAPCATVSEDGRIEWSDGFSDLLTMVSAEEEKVRARARARRARRKNVSK